MSKDELIEALADKEHAGWAHWMNYLFSKCDVIQDGDGYEHYSIPRELVTRWQRQAATPYADLSESEKQSDRNEVEHILPIIADYASRTEQNEQEYVPSQLTLIVDLQRRVKALEARLTGKGI